MFGRRVLTLVLVSWLHALAGCAATGARADWPVAVPREFRGVWVASVDNIDWPSRRELSTSQQQAELRAILDKAAELNFNAVILQVRPAADALYESSLEPWSEYLTGRMGVPPRPAYDPLAFAVREAHARGLELHAWFNPFRVRHPSARSPASDDHISRARPGLVRRYGTHLWMDPGEGSAQNHSLDVIIDVVRRYDIDGVHIDDYFYPYPQTDASGREIDFPDEPSWQRYHSTGGKLNRNDWRRENVNQFVERLYGAIKREKRHVKFGISPFGIWQPGHPAGIKGFNQYEKLYADARLWLREGWCDYFVPQLYWRIDPPQQSFTALLSWWAEENAMQRHLWPGCYLNRVNDGSDRAFVASEIPRQIAATRAQDGATGNVQFSAKSLLGNPGGVCARLAAMYGQPALVPATPWLDAVAPGRPALLVSDDARGTRVEIAPAGVEEVWLWLVFVRACGRWRYAILPGEQLVYEIGGSVSEVRVAAVDRCGNVGRAAAWR